MMNLRSDRNAPSAAGSKLIQSLIREVDGLLIGGDQLFREGLKRLFEGSPVNVEEDADSLTVAMESGRSQGPDVVVLLDPIVERESVERMRAVWPRTRVVVLAGRGDTAALKQAMAVGIDGYLPTDMSPVALVHSIHLVVMGENVFPTRMASDLLRGDRAGDGQTAGATRLTRREVDILRGLLDGQSNKNIGRMLGTSDATVKAQLRHLLRKIGAENRTQAALWARENGIGAADEVVAAHSTH